MSNTASRTPLQCSRLATHDPNGRRASSLLTQEKSRTTKPPIWLLATASSSSRIAQGRIKRNGVYASQFEIHRLASLRDKYPTENNIKPHTAVFRAGFIYRTCRRLHESNCQPMTMTSHPSYAARRISSNLNGSTKQFGWLQPPATILSRYPLPFSKPSRWTSSRAPLRGWVRRPLLHIESLHGLGRRAQAVSRINARSTSR